MEHTLTCIMQPWEHSCHSLAAADRANPALSIYCRWTDWVARPAIPCMHVCWALRTHSMMQQAAQPCKDCSPVEADEQVGELVQKKAVCQELCRVPLRHQLQGHNPQNMSTFSPRFTPHSAEQPFIAGQYELRSRSATGVAFSSALWPPSGVALCLRQEAQPG